MTCSQMILKQMALICDDVMDDGQQNVLIYLQLVYKCLTSFM